MATTTKIPTMNHAGLRNSQVLVGQGLFKQAPHVAFDPAADMVSVEDLVQSVKNCENRLNSLRSSGGAQHQNNHHRYMDDDHLDGEKFYTSDDQEAKSVPSPVPALGEKQKSGAAGASVRSRSPVPISQRPAWGRRTPQQGSSPMSTPRTRPSTTAAPSTRGEERDRPWRTASGSKPPLTPQTKAQRAVEQIEKEEESPPADVSPEHLSPRRHRAGTSAAATKAAAPRQNSVSRTRSPSPNIEATKRSTKPTVNSGNKSKSPSSSSSTASKKRSSSSTHHHHDAPASSSSDALVMMDQMMQRMVTLEATVATLQQHNEDLTKEVLNLRNTNHLMSQQHQAMATDFNGKIVALSSQLQYFMQQQYMVPHQQHAAAASTTTLQHQQHREHIPVSETRRAGGASLPQRDEALLNSATAQDLTGSRPGHVAVPIPVSNPRHYEEEGEFARGAPAVMMADEVQMMMEMEPATTFSLLSHTTASTTTAAREQTTARKLNMSAEEEEEQTRSLSSTQQEDEAGSRPTSSFTNSPGAASRLASAGPLNLRMA